MVGVSGDPAALTLTAEVIVGADEIGLAPVTIGRGSGEAPSPFRVGVAENDEVQGTDG